MTLKKLNEEKYSFETRLIYGKSFTKEWDYSHHVVPPMSSSATFRLDSVRRGAKGFSEFGQEDGHLSPIYIYDRLGEPNNDMLEDVLAIAEQGEECVTFSTGMAAIHAALRIFLWPGAEIIAHRTLYGCTFSLFKNWFSSMGIKIHFADLTKSNELEKFVNSNTRVVYLESPANPNLEMMDTTAVAKILKRLNQKRSADHKLISIIDNTFSTPFCQRPLTQGIDVVVHSLTKGIGGFGTDMGGAVITRSEFAEKLNMARKDFGASLSPRNAWPILVYGMPTLPLRMRQQQINAMQVAKFLEKHPAVDRVYYPGLPSFPQYKLAKRLLRDFDGNFAPGMMIFFTLKAKNPEASKNKGARLMDYIADNAYTITLAVSLGQLKTLIEHPGSMTHSAYSAKEQLESGIEPGGIRLAVGIENSKDIIGDLKAGLDRI